MAEGEEGKLFVGGIAQCTSVQKMQQYFSKYGEVVDSSILIDKVTGNPRGFGFVTFKDPASVPKVFKDRPHYIDGKQIDPKPCTPKDIQKQKKEAEIEHITKYKIFIGGLTQNMTTDEVKTYFEQFGSTADVVFALHKNSGQNKGFGFVTFEKDASAAKAVEKRFHQIGGKQVEAKAAEPLEKLRSAARASKQNAGDNMMQGPNKMYAGSGPPNYGGAGPNYGTAPPVQWGPPGYGPSAMGNGGGMNQSGGMPMNSGYGTYGGYDSTGGGAGYGGGVPASGYGGNVAAPGYPGSGAPSGYGVGGAAPGYGPAGSTAAPGYGYGYGTGYNGYSASTGFPDQSMANYSQPPGYSTAKAPSRSTGSDSRSYHPYKKH